jgi:amidase
MAGHLADLGHHVEEAAPAIDGAAFDEAFKMKWAQGAGAVVKGIRDTIAGDEKRPALLRAIVRRPALLRAFLHRYRRDGLPLLEQFTMRLAGIDAGYNPSDLYAAERVFATAEQALGDFFRDWDVLLTPVLSVAPGRIGSFDQGLPIPLAEQHLFGYAGFTPLANTSGYPAMSVPTLVTDDRLPIGTHFMASLGREDLLLQLAAQIEQSRGWATVIARA